MIHAILFIAAFLAGALTLLAAQDFYSRIHDWTVAAKVAFSFLVVYFVVLFLYA